MADQRLLAIVTILILMGTSGNAQQGASLDDLRTIEKLIESGDWRALYTYVEATPRLTAGDSALAVELRSFVEDAERGRLNQFDAAQRNAPVTQSAPINSIY